MVEAIKSISAPTAESPTKKRQHQITSITENLMLLYHEKKILIDLEMPTTTTDVDTQIRELTNKHCTLWTCRCNALRSYNFRSIVCLENYLVYIYASNSR